MKILQVDFEYDYGDKRRGLNQIGHYGILQSFKKLGHETELFAYDTYLDRVGQLQTDLIAKVKTDRPDLTFVSLFRDQFHPETLLELKKHTRTVSWFGDDTWRFDSFSKKYANLFSDVITTDPLAVEKYHAIGQKSVHLSQWAAINVPGQDPAEALQYERDVCFIGGANATRRWLISRLQKAGIRVDCYGHGWSGGVVSTEEMLRLFQTSKINLNLSNSVLHDWRFLLSGPRALKEYLRSGKTASQIKARNFEIPFAGGFQVTDYAPFIERYFDLGKEIICFAQIEEAADLIRYYLRHDAEREKIRKAGMARARRDHDYLNRLDEYLRGLPR